MKNKFLKLSLGLALAGCVAYADGLFLGYEGGYSYSKLELGKQSAKDTRGAPGLRLGYDFDIFRAYGSYHYSGTANDKMGNNKFKWKNHKFLLNADYTPSLSSSFKLVAGGYAGLNSIKIKSPAIKDGNGRDFIIGLRFGSEYSFDMNKAIEFGIKSDYTKYSIKSDSKKLKETDTALYVGYTYKF